MVTGLLRIFAIICAAFVCGKLVSKLKLPSILVWLIAGIVFGPYLAQSCYSGHYEFHLVQGDDKSIRMLCGRDDRSRDYL